VRLGSAAAGGPAGWADPAAHTEMVIACGGGLLSPPQVFLNTLSIPDIYGV
jgi:hypothetical protein